MTALSLAHYLVDLGGSGRSPRAGADAGSRGAGDLAVRLEEARLLGFDQGRAEAEGRNAVERVARDKAHAAALEAARAAWAREEGARLADLLSEGLRTIESRISAETASLLGPLLAEELRRSAVADLAATLGRLLGKGEVLHVEVGGPDDLVRALRERLEGSAIALEHVGADGVELRVVIGETTLSTELARWTARIEEALR